MTDEERARAGDCRYCGPDEGWEDRWFECGSCQTQLEEGAR